MRPCCPRLMPAFSLVAVLGGASVISHHTADTVEAHVAAAKVAAGTEHLALLGLCDAPEPARARHGHADHAGGAKYLQDQFGARVIMSAADWDLLGRDASPWPRPRRDLIATDGQKLTLGDTTLTLYLTPSHTPRTISTLIPVKDGGRSHLVAEWGGTGFNFTLTPDKPQRYWFETYRKSAERFRKIVAKAGADALISNHPSLDGSKVIQPSADQA